MSAVIMSVADDAHGQHASDTARQGLYRTTIAILRELASCDIDDAIELAGSIDDLARAARRIVTARMARPVRCAGGDGERLPA